MKSIYYTLSVAWKEIQVISKERAWLVILFLLPLMIGSFMGGANLVMTRSQGNVILLKVGLVNLDAGVLGRRWPRRFRRLSSCRSPFIRMLPLPRIQWQKARQPRQSSSPLISAR